MRGVVGRWWHAFWYGLPRVEMEPTSPFRAMVRAVAAFLLAAGLSVLAAVPVLGKGGVARVVVLNVLAVGSLLVLAGLAVRSIAMLFRHGPVDLSPLDPQ